MSVKLTSGLDMGTIRSSVPFGKEWLFLFLLFIPLSLGEDKLWLEIIDFSHAQVELSCRCDCAGNMTDTFFEVYKGKYSCLTSNSAYCQSSPQSNCDIGCRESDNPNVSSFVVKLDGTCEERILVRCTVSNIKMETILNLEESIELTAQSDPPEISLNDDQPLEASGEPIEIICSIKNICHKTELDIIGEVHMKHVSTTHTQEGSRFSTTAISTAIFYKAGNYTIICKEAGMEMQYSRRANIIVQPGANDTQVDHLKKMLNAYKEVNPWLIGLSAGFMIFMISTFIMGFRSCRKSRPRERSKKKKEGVEYIALSEGGSGTHQYPRKTPELLRTRDSISVIWIEKDERFGKKIVEFFKDRNKEVCRADFESISFVQEGPSYTKYIALISTQSIQNNEFFAFLTSVISRTCNVNYKSTVVLVLIHKIDSLKQLTEDLQAFPMVHVDSVLDRDCLLEIDYKLQGPSLRSAGSIGIGNVGVGLAWSHFFGYLEPVLQGIEERIRQSWLFEEYSGSMSLRFIIVIAAFGRTNYDLHDVDSRFSYIGKFEDFSKSVAWHPHRPNSAIIYQIKNALEKRYFFCGEYGYHILSLSGLLDSGKLTEVEMCKQLEEFASALQLILQKATSPGNASKSFIYVVRDITKLADGLCQYITKGTLPVDARPVIKEEGLPSSRVAQGFAFYYYHNHLEVIGPNMAGRIQATKYYPQKKMPKKLFILLPYSCRSHEYFKDVDLKTVGKLSPLKRTFAGLKFDYDNVIHEISSGSETYYACVEYCTHVHVMYEMEKEPLAGMSAYQKAAELRVFYEILNDMLSAPSAPDFCRNFELVYYNDDPSSEKTLSQILVEKVKECLQEEKYEDEQISVSHA